MQRSNLNYIDGAFLIQLTAVCLGPFIGVCAVTASVAFFYVVNSMSCLTHFNNKTILITYIATFRTCQVNWI